MPISRLSVPRALIGAVIAIALGAVATEWVHDVTMHGWDADIRLRNRACVQWEEMARVASFDRAGIWRETTTNARSVRESAGYWHARALVERYYTDPSGQVIRRPSGC